MTSTSVDQIELKDFFLKTLDACEKKAESVLKHYWEQVLLLAFYAQMQHSNPDTQNRLKLIECLGLSEQKTPEEQQDLLLILNMLEQGCSSHECYYYLKNHPDISCYQRLTRDIEQLDMHFAAKPDYFHPYRLWSIYQINKKFLRLNELLIYNFNSLKAKQYLAPFFEMQIHGYKPNTDTDIIDCYIENKMNKMFDLKSNLKVKVLSYFAYSMSYLFQELYGILDLFICKNPIEMRIMEFDGPRKTISMFDMLRMQERTQWMTISINRAYLNDLIAIGQIDTLMSSIKNRLIHEDDYQPRPNPENAVRIAAHRIEVMAKRWERTRSPLFNRLDQIPKLLATIFLYDFKQSTSYFSKFVNTEDPHKFSLVQQYNAVTNILKQLPSSAIIDAWQSHAEPRLSERFKHLPVNSKKNTIKIFDDLFKIINEQMNKGESDPTLFDLVDGFPPPFWFKGYRVMMPTDENTSK